MKHLKRETLALVLHFGVSLNHFCIGGFFFFLKRMIPYFLNFHFFDCFHSNKNESILRIVFHFFFHKQKLQQNALAARSS